MDDKEKFNNSQWRILYETSVIHTLKQQYIRVISITSKRVDQCDLNRRLEQITSNTKSSEFYTYTSVE